MHILLYSPDNGVTGNFMPHLWMFLLKALTPAEHKVFMIDENAQRLTEAEVARFVRDNHGQIVVFFIDDNFAINVRRTKSLLREMIDKQATLPWVAQISIIVSPCSRSATRHFPSY